MKIAIGSDHRGLELKRQVISLLEGKKHKVKDFGAYNQDSCDYPDFAFPVARGVSLREFDQGILICSTGNGMAIAANKVSGVRAALALTPEMARLARGHNDANVLILSADFGSAAFIQDIVERWLDTPFEGGRHARRIEKITAIEKGERH